MFRRSARREPRVIPAGANLPAAREAELGAHSCSRFRVTQRTPVSPAALESALDRCNAFLDGELHLEPMWEGCAAGGGLECTRRDGKPVLGKRSLRVRFSFDVWDAGAAALLPRTVSLRQGGPLASRRASRRQPFHQLCFESSAGTRRWSEKHMVKVTALLCVMLGWTPSGGTGLRSVLKAAAKIRREVGHAVRHVRFPRHTVARSAVPVPILTALCSTSSAARPQG